MVCLHVLVDVFGIVGAEPQLAVQLAGKHERTALGLAVAADGRKVLYGVFLQKLDNFIHDWFPPIEMMKNARLEIAISILCLYNNSVGRICKVSTLLCRSYQKETIEERYECRQQKNYRPVR